MKKSLLIFIFIFSFQSNVFAKENCKDLPGFKKLGKGLLSIGKTIKDTFMKYLGSPFMLLIKGIGLALLTAGVFKFFASP